MNSLKVMADKLHVYDVVQNGWEHEGLGYEFNATHVLMRLAQDIIAKDFNDEKVARSAIAPDVVQYALRLYRWTDQDAGTLAITDEETQSVYKLAGRFGSMRSSQIAYLKAVALLGNNLHKQDYEQAGTDANEGRQSTVQSVGGLLVYCATQLSYQYRFDLAEAFDVRLMSLRTRFNIPQPPVIV